MILRAIYICMHTSSNIYKNKHDLSVMYDMRQYAYFQGHKLNLKIKIMPRQVLIYYHRSTRCDESVCHP